MVNSNHLWLPAFLKGENLGSVVSWIIQQSALWSNWSHCHHEHWNTETSRWQRQWHTVAGKENSDLVLARVKSRGGFLLVISQLIKTYVMNNWNFEDGKLQSEDFDFLWTVSVIHWIQILTFCGQMVLRVWARVHVCVCFDAGVKDGTLPTVTVCPWRN